MMAYRVSPLAFLEEGYNTHSLQAQICRLIYLGIVS
jgi:hypothetical protein